MINLILQNLGKRKIQSCSAFLAVLVSVAVLFALFLLYDGVSKGIETSRQRMGADLVVVPSEAGKLADETDLLLTGAPATIYMNKNVEEIIAGIKGVAQTTAQFYGQSLGSSCCSTGAELRVVGYDSSTDWMIQPWANQKIGRDLAANEVVIGCDVGGFDHGAGFLLGQKMSVASVLEVSGTSLDTSVLMDINTVRRLSKEIKNYDHFWEKYGQPENLVSAIMVKTKAGKKDAAANLIEMKGDFHCIKSSDVMDKIQSQMKIIFLIMLGTGLLINLASIFQLFARFYSMAWDRKSELGLYRAMGASRRDLKALILGEAMLLTGGGALLGFAAGAGIYKLMLVLLAAESTFPFIAPSLPSILAGMGLLLVAFAVIGYLAVCAPLRQIAKIDPSMAMQKNDID